MNDVPESTGSESTDPESTDPESTDPESTDPESTDRVTRVRDLRVIVERIDGEPKCGLQPGDYFELRDSCRLTIPSGGHFCPYALAAVLPLLPAKQRALAAGDWMAGDQHVACPDPDERLIMRIDLLEAKAIPTDELT